jgi:hypothetical protein
MGIPNVWTIQKRAYSSYYYLWKLLAAWGLRGALLCRILLPSSFGPELIRGSGLYTVLWPRFTAAPSQALPLA